MTLAATVSAVGPWPVFAAPRLPAARPRLFAAAVTALALHAALLALIRLPVATGARPLSAWLEVRTLPAMPDGRVAADGNRAEAHAAKDRNAARFRAPADAEAPVHQAAPMPTADARGDPPAPGAAALVEAARRLARSFAVERGTAPDAQALPQIDRPALPQLDRALRREAAGEKLVGAGIVKITDASGRSYCLKLPPDAPRDGPLPPFAVPMTCP